MGGRYSRMPKENAIVIQRENEMIRQPIPITTRENRRQIELVDGGMTLLWNHSDGDRVAKLSLSEIDTIMSGGTVVKKVNFSQPESNKEQGGTK